MMKMVVVVVLNSVVVTVVNMAMVLVRDLVLVNMMTVVVVVKTWMICHRCRGEFSCPSQYVLLSYKIEFTLIVV
jgi:hypothetical protein